MNNKRFGGINIEVLLKMIILLGFSWFFYFVIKTGNIQYYVHPRIIPYMKFAIVGFILISLFLSDELCKIRKKNAVVIDYIIFIIALIIAFISPPKTMVSKSISLDNENTESSLEDDFEETNLDFEEEDQKLEIEQKYKLTFIDNTIVINDDSFIPWVNELYMNIGKYEGEKVEITGFILKDDRFKQNEFVIARLLMVCCAADMQTVGFLCRYDKASELEVDSWFQIRGTIKYENFNEENMPIIEIENLKKINKPDSEFLYPY